MSPDPDPLAAIVRAALRARRVPPGSACEVGCRSERLIATPGGRIVCYRHRRAETGADGPEVDHIAGWANLGGLVAQLEPNAHRDVTEVRAVLGMGRWPLADGSPILLAAHVLGGLATILWLVARWLVDYASWLKGTPGDTGEGPSPPFPIER